MKRDSKPAFNGATELDAPFELEVGAEGVPAGDRALKAGRRLPSVDIELDADLMTPAGPVVLEAIGRIGRYELLGRLAVGGMAEVFLARERSTGGAERLVVVKLVRPEFAKDNEFVQLFLTEGRTTLGLTHPHICAVYEFGEADGVHFIAMEWVRGVRLSDLVRRAREQGLELPLSVVLKVGAQVADALHYVHTARDHAGRPLDIIHRDVSPHNIMVTYDGSVKLLDFGVAKGNQTAEAHVSQSGTVKGNFGYVAPEQCLGRHVDARADVFSLGVVLWEILTGRRLFKRDSEYKTLQAVVEERPPDVRELASEVPSGVALLLKRALEKAPSDRFASAGQMQEALEREVAETREVVSSSRIGALMAALYFRELREGPTLETDPTIVTRHALSSGSPDAAPPKAARPAPVAAVPPAVPPPPPAPAPPTPAQVDAPTPGPPAFAEEPPDSVIEGGARRAGLARVLVVLFLLALGGAGGVHYWNQQQRSGSEAGGDVDEPALPGEAELRAVELEAAPAEGSGDPERDRAALEALMEASRGSTDLDDDESLSEAERDERRRERRRRREQRREAERGDRGEAPATEGRGKLGEEPDFVADPGF